MDSTIFVVMWDSEGLDGIINATERNQADVFNTLSGDRSNSLGHMVDSMMLRARFNCHRCCEIYSINVDEEITADDIAGWFEHNPQGAADLIRERGKMLLSQRKKEKRQVIA